MVQYSRVSYSDRCQIVALLKSNKSVREIASLLNFDKSTIYRELKRNRLRESSQSLTYDADAAHSKCLKRKKSQGRKSIIKGNLKEYILKYLKLGWSPELIAGRYRREKKCSLSHQTIYDYIKKNRELRPYLRFGTKRGIGRRAQNNVRKQKLLSIHQRPESANNRSRFGHWERDGMYGANRKQILVCLERKSRLVRLGHMPTTNASLVSKITEETLSKDKVLTITNDNGTEFRRPETIKFPVYYCDAMKPEQRGSVENVVGKLRRYITRKTDLDLLSERDLKRIEDIYNNTPRRIFDYRTPLEVYYNKTVALVY